MKQKGQQQQQQDMNRDTDTKSQNSEWADVGSRSDVGRGDVDEGMVTDEDMKR